LEVLLELLSNLKMDKTKQEFVVFIHEALADRHSPAHEELYEFLVAI
jgi:hypothetical protein